MEETLFEYRYTENEDSIRRMYKYLLFRHMPRPVLIAVLCAFLVAFIVISIFYTVMNINPLSMWILTAIYALFLAWLPLTYFRLVSARKKQYAEMFGDRYPEENVLFCENEMHVGTNGKFVAQTPYSSVKSIKETDDAIILITKSRIVYYLSKEGFVKGTPGQLKEFILSKGIKR